ncbi:MAG TPA: hypothetical protein PLT66_09190 [Bacillota bacterium]|nr:hypothetical protein [Bacillota bacterium]
MKVIEKYGLSERHARELIRIKDEQKRKSILSCAALEQLSIKQTQQFADRALLSQQPEELLSECQTAAITADTPAEAIKVNRNQTMTGKKVFMLRDVRAFFVSLDKYMLFLKKAGVDCTKQRCETDEYVEIRIRIPKYAAKNF